MNEYWENLSERERRLLGGGAVVLVLAILYWGIWSPISDTLEQERMAVAGQEAQLSWMQQKAAEVVQLRAAGKRASSSGSLSTLVNGSARSKGISLSRIQPQDEDLQVWIDQVSFNVLLSWLGDMQSEKGVNVRNLDISATDVPGEVRERRLVLTRG